MSIDFNGATVAALVPGDREYRFRLPHNTDTVPPKTMEAIAEVQEATKAAASARSYKAQQEAGAAVREAVGRLFDRAASTSQADAQHHREGYAYAQARYTRALGEAEAALQAMADHAQQYDNGTGIGFPEDPRGKSQAVAQLHLVADALQHLPAPSGLQER
ncbi:hypothetical protein [Streptomyces sp. NPDC050416]|uniref:hypothetical protein n=1 Tax=Streptomyces sp. NPDC050416 TaxID=3365611 RepID=UPI00379832FD